MKARNEPRQSFSCLFFFSTASFHESQTLRNSASFGSAYLAYPRNKSSQGETKFTSRDSPVSFLASGDRMSTCYSIFGLGTDSHSHLGNKYHTLRNGVEQAGNQRILLHECMKRAFDSKIIIIQIYIPVHLGIVYSIAASAEHSTNGPTELSP